MPEGLEPHFQPVQALGRDSGKPQNPPHPPADVFPGLIQIFNAGCELAKNMSKSIIYLKKYIKN